MLSLRATPVLVCIGVLFCSGGRIHAAAVPDKGVIHYSLTQWSHRDGLDSTTIYAIAQTADGFLWLGTADGLIRFDGIRFYRIPRSDREAALGRVRALATSTDGALWAGTDSGQLIRVVDLTTQRLRLNGPVTSIRERPDFSIEVETPGEVSRISQSMQVQTTCRRPAVAECQLLAEPSVAASILREAGLAPDQIRSVLPDSQGSLWLATRESGIVRIGGAPAEGRPVIERISVSDGLSSDSVWSILEDRERNIWIGTQNGLTRLREDKFSTITHRVGLSSDNVNSLAVVGTKVFAGSAAGLDEVSAAGVESLAHESVLSLAASHDGTLFAGTPQGLVNVQDGHARPVSLGIEAVQITVMAQASTGELWLYDQRGGVFRVLHDHAAVQVTDPALLLKRVSVMQADARGGMWFGLDSEAVVHYDGAVFHTFKASDGLPGGVPNAISLDSDGSVWIASERGLAHYRGGRLNAWSKQNGLPGSRILWAVPGPEGRLWLGYNIGVASVLVSDLEHATNDPSYKVPYYFYDEGDGLHSNPDLHGSTPVVVLPTGRLWFTTSEGLATIDPTQIRTNPIPPPVQFTQLTVDDVNVDVANAVTLPSLTRRIEIGYTGLSFTDPHKVTFRYRLMGFDSTWHAASTPRVATYTNLPPGSYQFQVLAANDDGVWSTQPALLNLTILPAYYQTTWFIVLTGALLLSAIVLLVRSRIRDGADRLRSRFEERLDERARVARDLHDNLLQDVMGISLQLEIADELTPQEAGSKAVLRRALQLSASAMTQGRGALTTMRATLSERTNVIQALQRVATQFPENRHRIIRYSTEGDELPLQAGIGEEIVQIASEALRNALQHTTGRIEVRLRYARTRFIVAVDDEGAGMSRAVLESGVPDHFGLRGMRERAARIAASLDIESTPGYGTKIRLVVPGRIAYAAGAARRGAWNTFKARWSRLHRRA